MCPQIVSHGRARRILLLWREAPSAIRAPASTAVRPVPLEAWNSTDVRERLDDIRRLHLVPLHWWWWVSACMLDAGRFKEIGRCL